MIEITPKHSEFAKYDVWFGPDKIDKKTIVYANSDTGELVTNYTPPSYGFGDPKPIQKRKFGKVYIVRTSED